MVSRLIHRCSLNVWYTDWHTVDTWQIFSINEWMGLYMLVFLGPVASSSPASFWEMENMGPHPRTTRSESVMVLCKLDWPRWGTIWHQIKKLSQSSWPAWETPRWQSRRTCACRLLRELQNYSLLLNNRPQEKVGSHQKKIPHIQGQRRSPSKTMLLLSHFSRVWLCATP